MTAVIGDNFCATDLSVRYGTFHVQCRLKRGTTRQVSYIPQKFAVIGKALRLKNIKGEWEDGWQVEMTSGRPLPSDYVRERGNDYRSQREASDI